MKSIKLIVIGSSILFSNAHAGVTAIDPSAMQDYYVQPDIASSPLRDPFTPSTKMYRESGAQTFDPYDENSFVPMSTRLPKMWVRGFVNDSNGKRLALLQIQGEETVYMVSAGDKIGIQTQNNIANPNMVLEIISVDNKQVRVREGNLGQIVVVQ